MAMTVPHMPLPEILPVFPLTGVMLLPGTVLPLHIFEPRYRALVEDTLEGEKIFGMIQPLAPQNDNRGPQPGAEGSAPDLYKVGCAGYIEKWEKLPDGRFFVQLKGVNRFRFNEELALQRGYRRVKAMYREFSDAGRSKSGSATARRFCRRWPVSARRTACKYGRTKQRVFRSGINESSRCFAAFSSGGKAGSAGSAEPQRPRANARKSAPTRRWATRFYP